MVDTFERRGRRTGFAAIPHEFWTLRLADDANANSSALILLGWLHSHQPDYLGKLSQRGIAEQLRWSRNRVAGALDTLAAGGWVLVELVDDARTVQRRRIVLDDDHFADWLEEAVAARRGSGSEPRRGSGSEPRPAPSRGHGRGSESEPPSLEHEQVENEQGEQRALVLVGDTFDAFWEAYPRRVAKPDARRAFKTAVKLASVTAVLDGVAAWAKFWIADRTPESRIPYPATWLNREQWNDQPPTATPQRQGQASMRLDTDRSGEAVGMRGSEW